MTRERPGRRARGLFGAAIVPPALFVVILTATACRATPVPEAADDLAAPTPRAELTTGAAPGSGETAATPATTAPPGPEGTSIAKATELAAAALPSVERVFGSAGIAPGEMMLPVDVALDADGNVYVSDSKGVQRFAPDGTFSNQIGANELKTAQGIAVAPDGTVYVTGMGALVQVFDRDGQPIGTIGTEGTAPGQLQQPVDAALDPDGNLLVVDARNYRIEKYAPDGRHLLSIGGRGTQPGQFESPRSIAVDPEGRIFVGMGDDYLIQRLASDGTYIDSIGKAYAEETMWRTGGVTADDRGRVFATRSIGHAIQAFDGGDAPALLWEYGSLGIEPGQFNAPTGIAYRDGRLYVADTSNNRVQVLLLP